MKILIKGYYGFGNLGDDILMLVSYGLVRKCYPNAEVSVFSNYTKNLNGFDNRIDYNEYIFKILQDKTQLVDWTQKGYYDLIVYGGGGIYFDHSKGSTVMRVVNWGCKLLGVHAVYKLDQLLRMILNRPHKINSKRKIAIGIGIGKYSLGSKLFYHHMADMGSVSKFFVRDAVSHQKLKKLKYGRNIERVIDLAFLDNYWAGGVKMNIKNTKSVGIILLDWDDNDSVRFHKMKNLAKELGKHEFEVSFYSFDQNHDKKYIEFFLNQPINIWEPNEMELTSYLQNLSQHQYIITARAHGAILGAILGVIPICIDISIKLREVAAMFPDSGTLIKDSASCEQYLHEILRIHENIESYQLHLKSDIEKGKLKIHDLELEVKSTEYS